MATSRTLEILIKATDQAKKPLEGIGGQLAALNPQIKTLAVTSGIAFAAVTAAIGLSVRAYANAGDALAKMSQRTGIGVQALSELKHAAELSGTSIEAIEVSTKMMSATLVEAARGTDSAVQSLGMLGLKAADFANLNAEQSFLKMAGAVADIENPMLRARAATEVFGKQGTQLLPMLSQGSAGLQKMRDEAIALGITFDSKAAAAAERFNDSMTRLKSAFTGTSNAVGAAFLPALTRLADMFTPIISKIGALIRAHPQLTAGVLTAVAAFLGMVTALATIVLVSSKVVVAFRLMGIAASTALGPIGLLIGGVAILAGLFVSNSVAAEKSATEVGGLTDEMAGMNGTNAASLASLAETGAAMKQLGEDAKATAKNIASVEKAITATMQDNADKQQSYKENLAQAFIDQEKKVADLTQEIRDKSHQKSQDGNSEASASELADLRDQLATEKDALNSMSVYKTGIEAELIEMKRRSNLTEFELKVENLMRQRVEELKAHLVRLQDQMAEREELKAHLAEIMAQQKGLTEGMAAENAARVKDAQQAAAAVSAAWKSATSSSKSVGSTSVSSISTKSIPKFADGGIVNKPTIGLIGEAGPEAVIPLSRLSGAGGITINFSGSTFMGREGVAETIGKEIINILKRDQRI